MNVLVEILLIQTTMISQINEYIKMQNASTEVTIKFGTQNKTQLVVSWEYPEF